MKNIASERVRLGMTQDELAEKVGVSPSTVARWEQDKGSPTGYQLVAMHDLFNCSVDYLLEITGDRTAKVPV